ncbi:MAG: hypothetical protein G01um101433_285 [Parcubacteria group bacterium Gr01-1014_33]|nr:MAG: hypothetical protein G01um101433_285 [Parcubacteria group bacterium Gr01-1014_33]
MTIFSFPATLGEVWVLMNRLDNNQEARDRKIDELNERIRSIAKQQNEEWQMIHVLSHLSKGREKNSKGDTYCLVSAENEPAIAEEFFQSGDAVPLGWRVIPLLLVKKALCLQCREETPVIGLALGEGGLAKSRWTLCCGSLREI